MVSIGGVNKNGGRSVISNNSSSNNNNNRSSKSKVFTMLILGIGLTVLLVVYKVGSSGSNGGPRGGGGGRSGTTQKLVGSFVANGSDQRSATIDVEYGALDSNKDGEQKIRQISLIGERNSGTRWTFA